MNCREARNDVVEGALSIRCPSAKSIKKDKKLPITTKYVFTNTKKDGNISTQKYLRNLPKGRINGEIAENEPAMGWHSLDKRVQKWFTRNKKEVLIMKKAYETPMAVKYVFDYQENVVASITGNGGQNPNADPNSCHTHNGNNVNTGCIAENDKQPNWKCSNT